jgi:hypothetical protein
MGVSVVQQHDPCSTTSQINQSMLYNSKWFHCVVVDVHFLHCECRRVCVGLVISRPKWLLRRRRHPATAAVFVSVLGSQTKFKTNTRSGTRVTPTRAMFNRFNTIKQRQIIHLHLNTLYIFKTPLPSPPSVRPSDPSHRGRQCRQGPENNNNST